MLGNFSEVCVSQGYCTFYFITYYYFRRLIKKKKTFQNSVYLAVFNKTRTNYSS